MNSKHQLILLLSIVLSATTAFALSPAEDPIKVTVCKRKEQVIRLTPNPSPNGMIKVVSECREPLHFYVFDVEGTMLYNALLVPGEEKMIEQLKKGVYSYDVFRKDEGVEQGKITVL